MKEILTRIAVALECIVDIMLQPEQDTPKQQRKKTWTIWTAEEDELLLREYPKAAYYGNVEKLRRDSFPNRTTAALASRYAHLKKEE